MAKYSIESKSGIVWGTYEGASEEEALAAMLEEAGDAEYSDGSGNAGGTADDWIIKAVDA